jgi:hypothetical protein
MGASEGGLVATMLLESHPEIFQAGLSLCGAARDPWHLRTSAVPSTLDVLFFSVWGANDILEVAGGQPYGNQSTSYMGSRKDAALNAGVERIQSDLGASAYIQQFYEPTGILKHPLVILHNTWDDAVPFSHEVTYRKRVISAGYRQFLTVLAAPQYGHCEFTASQLFRAFNLMVRQANEDRNRIP